MVFKGAKIITQAKLIEGFAGAIDFTIEWTSAGGTRRILHVEVDGEQHFTKDYHDVRKETQLQIDREKDDLIFEQGQCLVRLHYKDTNRWAASLRKAKSMAEKYPTRNFILYGKSYAMQNRLSL